jgi:hypothetical protein
MTHAIEVQVIEIGLENAAKYNALSYAWNSPAPDTFVICNDTIIPITKNCQLALNQIRKNRNVGRELIFVDAICINQDSVDERNHQVAIMGDIYSKSTRVICWLGDFEVPPRVRILRFIGINLITSHCISEYTFRGLL